MLGKIIGVVDVEEILDVIFLVFVLENELDVSRETGLMNLCSILT